MSTDSGADLLGPSQVRALADRLELRPTKQWGQNFVVDANTVRRIVRLAGVEEDDRVLEVGPGLGSLTLGLLPVAAGVTALEIDPVLAEALPETVAQRAAGLRRRLTVMHADALSVTEMPDPQPTVLVANLPYNVAVPVVLHLLAQVPTLRAVLVMVQLEVAERLAAGPGSRTYGVPSAKAAWYAQVSLAGRVSRSVFWPVPHVDSGLVRMLRRPTPVTAATRQDVFAVVDAAFAQRRKTLRAALSGWAGSAAEAERCLRAAGIDPRSRGEQVGIEGFAALAQARGPSVRPSHESTAAPEESAGKTNT